MLKTWSSIFSTKPGLGSVSGWSSEKISRPIKHGEGNPLEMEVYSWDNHP
jgi:hypothetical protein